MKYVFVIILFTIYQDSLSQNCNCLSNFEWVKSTFEKNDAGFQFAINNKGIEAYKNHNERFLEKIRLIKQSEECTKKLYEWLTFFRAGHIAIRRLTSNNPNTTISSTNKTTSWENLAITKAEFEEYLSSKKELEYEGIWETGVYKIGIKQTRHEYVGYILETSSENWKIGDVKLKFQKGKGTFYLRDKSAEDFTQIKLLGKTHLQLGRFQLSRIYPKYDTEKSIENYLKSLNATKPYIEKINSKTLLFRIPSFLLEQKKYIDSVIRVNKKNILENENLIIDLRDNGGGNDLSYKELIPFLYTNPIREVGSEFLSTKLNNQGIIDFINSPNFKIDDKTKIWAKKSYEKLEKKLGSFINLDSAKVSVQKLDTIFGYPKKIGIIINKANASSAEQFLLAAKQSKKVKLFGSVTSGFLDISNVNFVKSPCNEFELGYCLTKSFRIPNMSIDGIGIQPDYFLDDEIDDYKWIDYASMILNQI